MSIFGDIFGAAEKLIEFHRINEWIKLYTSLICSFWFGGVFVCGSALMLHRPGLEAIGEGLVSGVVCAVRVWRYSPLTKGLMLSLPAEEAGKELNTNSQTIIK